MSDSALRPAMPEVSPPALARRTWCYVQPPRAYAMAACACGNHDTQWSEFAGHLWCARCEKDFIPEHNGVFDGPIPLGAATMLGMCFDRIDLATETLQRFDHDTGQWLAA